jgi:hypothetical protein
LIANGAEEQAALLTRVNPGRLLENEPVLPVAPVRGARGLLRRMTDALTGKRR